MAGTTTASQFSDSVGKQVEELRSRVSGNGAAVRMWRDLMTENDRKRLRTEADKEPHQSELDEVNFPGMPIDDVELRDGSAGKQLHRCFYRWGAVGMWMRLKGLTRPIAIVDLAYESGFVHEATKRRLLESLGARRAPRLLSKKPIWDREEKTLRFEGSIVRRIRSLKVAHKIVPILDHFQENGWRSPIPCPLNAKGQVLHGTIYSLNVKSNKLAFHVCNDGESISWSRR
jgi:hypothetical protein